MKNGSLFRKYKILGSLLVIVFLFCGISIGLAKDNQVTLHWYMWAEQSQIKSYQDMADLVHTKYPNITVKLEAGSWNYYWDQLTMKLASNEPLDIIGMQGQRVATFASKNALLPINSLVKQDKFDLSPFNPVMIQAMSFKNNLYGLPWDFGTFQLFYNKDLFKKYGVPFPSSNPKEWTWDTFLETAKKLTKDTNGDGVPDTYGFAAPSGLEYGPYTFILQNGGDIQNSTLTKSGFSSPKAVEAMQFYADLINKYKVAPPISDTRNEQWHLEQFATGKIGMVQEGIWITTYFESVCKFDWDIAMCPSGKAGPRTYAAGSGYAITKKTKYPKEAWQALQVLTGPEGAEIVAKERSYPAYLPAVPTFTALHKNLSLDIVAKQQQYAIPFRTPSTFQEANTTIWPWLDKICLNRVSVSAGLKEINTIYQKMLDKHNNKK